MFNINYYNYYNYSNVTFMLISVKVNTEKVDVHMNVR